jgi:hypothetical protein
MNADTAYNYLKELFRTLDKPVWGPYGFDKLWGLYYLKSEGMSYDKVVEAIKTYNEIARMQVFEPESKNNRGLLFDKLREISQF